MRRQRPLRFALVGGLFGLLIVAGSVAAASTAAVKIGETAGKYHFSPTTTFVNVGGKVTWTNGSDAPHTVTSNSGGELGSPTIGAGKTYSHTFAATGTFAYHCTIHTYMTGKVVVLAAGATPPPTDASLPVATATGGPNVGGLLLILVGVGGTVLALRRFGRSIAG